MQEGGAPNVGAEALSENGDHVRKEEATDD